MDRGWFAEKESIRAHNKSKFAGFVSFLCQVFRFLRSSDRLPYQPLVSPIIECLALSLDKDASEEEVECACEQVRPALLTYHVFMSDPDAASHS